ncbi:hypothetical protein Pan44_54360 [Caulifigura coniformis]|uniref:Uncharacterized protein n=1 Tax=Caulifigura coniformis TaxID=2527983 RepID=A0A517SML4_9PLAN|nr:hypothetical protein [Caulifigura coniformis]QDT57367.1 hypothetical protein Pan44_54360 [Caulifigura coniformis]
MTIAMGTVKQVCTAAEVVLVKLSRRPEVGRLSSSEARRLAVRARKALDKWEDRKRSQARGQSRQTGFGEASERTAVKCDIFREALTSFEQQAAKGDSGATTARRVPKPGKAAGQRKERAAARQGMTGTTRRRRPKPVKQETGPNALVVDGVTVGGPTAGAASAAAPGKKKAGRGATGTAITGVLSNRGHLRQPSRARAVANAKKARLLESGVKTRIAGHVSSQGKRKQARKDDKSR